MSILKHALNLLLEVPNENSMDKVEYHVRVSVVRSSARQSSCCEDFHSTWTPFDSLLLPSQVECFNLTRLGEGGRGGNILRSHKQLWNSTLNSCKKRGRGADGRPYIQKPQTTVGQPNDYYKSSSQNREYCNRPVS